MTVEKKEVEVLEPEIEITEKEVSLDAETEREQNQTETKPEAGETKDSAEWADLAAEVGLEADADPREILKEYVALREGKPKLEKMSELEREALRLGYADADHLLEAMRGYDPSKAKAERRAEQTQTEKKAAKEFALGDWKSGYDEPSRKLANSLAADVINHIREEMAGQNGEGKYEELGEAVGTLANNFWFLELKETVREQGKKLTASKQRLIKIADDYQLGRKAAASGENPLVLANRIYETLENGQKPGIAQNGKTGIDKAKAGEKPGGQKTTAERIPLTPDGEPDWQKMTPDQMHKLVERMPHR